MTTNSASNDRSIARTIAVTLAAIMTVSTGIRYFIVLGEYTPKTLARAISKGVDMWDLSKMATRDDFALTTPESALDYVNSEIITYGYTLFDASCESYVQFELGTAVCDCLKTYWLDTHINMRTWATFCTIDSYDASPLRRTRTPRATSDATADDIDADDTMSDEAESGSKGIDPSPVKSTRRGRKASAK